MIDDDRTMELFGYTSEEISPKSCKEIVAVCEECGKYRTIQKGSYRELCFNCARYKCHELPSPIFVNENDRFIKDMFIDRIETIKTFGYDPIDLSPKSGRKVVVICKKCGKYRVVKKQGYRDLCISCAQKMSLHPKWSKESRHNRSIATMGENNPFFGKHHSPENIPARWGENNGMYGKKHTEESKQLMSAKLQNVPIEDWEGYSKEKRYCNMWTGKLRERVRNKFDRLCFMCGKDEKTNGRKLSVHHIGNDRNQGCDGMDWKLVPLCNSCHGKISHDPDVWEKLITDTIYYINDGKS